MDKTFQTRIKHKRDSQANWETNNPVLLDGELGIVVMSDGKIKTKVGDGVTNYNLLPFSSSDVELTWENIENRPFGEMPGDTLTWDGNTDGLESVSSSNGLVFFKISDAIITRDDIMNGYEITISNGYSEQTSGENAQDIYDTIGCCYPGPAFCPTTDGASVEIDGVTIVFPTAGVWHLNADFMEGDYMKSFTIPGYTGFSSIKKIDPKYLPPLTKEQLPAGYPWSEQTVIEWDGNTEGKIVFGGQFYKVSNKTPTIEDVGKDFEMTATSIVNEEGQSVELSVTNTITEIASGVFAIGDNAFVCPNDAVGVDIMGVVFEEAGIYFNCPEVGLYVSSLTYGTVTPISETLLPNSVVIASDDAVETDIIPNDAIKYSVQTLTDSQKAQVRENIGTLSADEIADLISQNITQSVEEAIGGSY